MNAFASNPVRYSPAGISLTERAMVAYVNVSQWSARRLDKKVTAETNAAHNAESDAGRYNKLLISRDHIAEIQRIAGRARADHYTMTLPWLDSGGRVLPAMGYDKFMAAMAKHKSEFESAVAGFVAGYPAFIEESRARLNGMFNESDYPLPADIARRFGFDIAIMPIPDSGDFRVDRPDAESIRNQIESATAQALQTAMRDAWQRIADCVNVTAEKLRAYRPADGNRKAENVFRDSLVSNLNDLIELLPGLNIAGDKAMDKVIDCMRQHLAGINPDTLRGNDSFRAETARKAEVIAKAVNQFMC